SDCARTIGPPWNHARPADSAIAIATKRKYALIETVTRSLIGQSTPEREDETTFSNLAHLAPRERSHRCPVIVVRPAGASSRRELDDGVGRARPECFGAHRDRAVAERSPGNHRGDIPRHTHVILGQQVAEPAVGIEAPPRVVRAPRPV